MARLLEERMDEDKLLQIVRRELADYVEESPFSAEEIKPETSLFADLGFDSVTLVGMVAAIEDALEIEELPLMAWSDQQSEQGIDGFTVGSLVTLCFEAGVLRN